MRSTFREEQKREGAACLFAAPAFLYLDIDLCWLYQSHPRATDSTVLPECTWDIRQPVRPILNSTFKSALLRAQVKLFGSALACTTSTTTKRDAVTHYRVEGTNRWQSDGKRLAKYGIDSYDLSSLLQW